MKEKKIEQLKTRKPKTVKEPTKKAKNGSVIAQITTLLDSLPPKTRTNYILAYLDYEIKEYQKIVGVINK